MEKVCGGIDLSWKFLLDAEAPVEGTRLGEGGVVCLEGGFEGRTNGGDSIGGVVGVVAYACESACKVFELGVLVVETDARGDFVFDSWPGGE